MPQNKFTISNILIFLSFIATIGVTIFPNLYQFGINRIFFDQSIYHIWAIQFFTSQFLHGNFLHFLSNAIFIIYFGNIVERHLSQIHFLLFFIGNAIFIGLFLTYLDAGNTVGISGFGLALLTYYTLLLWKNKNREFTGGITAILVNIFIGFIPGISFWGHFGGMIFGGVYFFIMEYVFQKGK